MIKSFKIADKFYLNSQTIPAKAPPKQVEIPLNHICVIDCSGSMSHDLPEIRSQLKNRLPSLLRESDTISIIWFSGRNQYGVLIENFEVVNAKDLSNLNRSIDRFLTPMGLTGFKQPLEEVAQIIRRVKTNAPYSLFFMSDGCDNQWSEAEILRVSEALQPQLMSAAIVEYGWYCNRPLMAKMAASLGGTLLFSENFKHYDPLFESAMKKKIFGGKKVEITLKDVPLYGLAFSLDEDVVTYAVESTAKLLVPETTLDVYYFSGVPYGKETIEMTDALYAALNIFSSRMLGTEVTRILKSLGDVRLIKQFSNCFGKQAYSDFQNNALECVKDPAKRLKDGHDPNLVPDEDAFTVLDVLYELSQDDGNLFYPNHPLFEYNRIGRKAVAAEDVLTESEQDELIKIGEELSKTRDPKRIKLLRDQISHLADKKTDTLKFTYADPDRGYSVSALVLNESRPNVSARVRIDGSVYLPPSILPAKISIPNPFPTSIWRAYTVIRDGILNVQKLPVSLTEDTFEVLVEEGLVRGKYDPKRIYELDLRRLPIINRRMVESVSAQTLFQNEYGLLKLKAAQKVYKYFLDQRFEKVSENLAAQYGTEAAMWLKEQGITDSGFNPKTVLAEATDYYMGRELDIAIKGLSSLPSVKDVLVKLEKKTKLTLRETLLVPAIHQMDALDRQYSGDHFKSMLTHMIHETVTEVRNLMRAISETKFSILVGQVWFKEFSSLDDSAMQIDTPDGPIWVTATLKEIEVKI